MRGSVSPENIVRTGLAALGCSVLAFADLFGMHRPTLSEIFGGKRDFTPQEAERAQERLREMLELQNETAVSIDWSNIQMQKVLHERRVRKAEAELAAEAVAAGK